MCGMGAMGCVEYADGSEELTMGREQMLAELNLDAAPAKVVPESCAVEDHCCRRLAHGLQRAANPRVHRTNVRERKGRR